MTFQPDDGPAFEVGDPNWVVAVIAASKLEVQQNSKEGLLHLIEKRTKDARATVECFCELEKRGIYG